MSVMTSMAPPPQHSLCCKSNSSRFTWLLYVLEIDFFYFSDTLQEGKFRKRSGDMLDPDEVRRNLSRQEGKPSLTPRLTLSEIDFEYELDSTKLNGSVREEEEEPSSPQGAWFPTLDELSEGRQSGEPLDLSGDSDAFEEPSIPINLLTIDETPTDLDEKIIQSQENNMTGGKKDTESTNTQSNSKDLRKCASLGKNGFYTKTLPLDSAASSLPARACASLPAVQVENSTHKRHNFDKSEFSVLWLPPKTKPGSHTTTPSFKVSRYSPPSSPGVGSPRVVVRKQFGRSTSEAAMSLRPPPGQW